VPSFISTSLILTQFVTTEAQVHLNESSVHEFVALGLTLVAVCDKASLYGRLCVQTKM
jgi:hypothetical protein